MPALGGIQSRLDQQKLFFSRVPFIDEIMVDNLDAPSLSYQEVFTVRNSSRAFENITGLTGLGLFDQKAEGAPITYDALLEAYDKTFTHLTYSKGTQITREAMRDDIDGVISDTAPALAKSARVSIETTAWNVFNNGFSSETTPDGQPLFSNSHVLIGDSPTTGVDNLVVGDVGVATIEAMLNLFSDIKNERGLPTDIEPDRIVAHPHQKWDIYEILKSQLRSDTANNTANAFNQIGLKPVFSKYIVGPDDFFIGTAPGQHKVIMYWREQPTIDHTMDFETGNGKSKMEYALSVGAADWRGWVGSQG